MSSLPDALQAGLEHHRAGRLLEAEQAYLNVLAAQPRHAGALNLLGLLAFQAGRLEIAEKLLTDAVKINGFHAPYLADLAEVLRAEGKIDAAIERYRKALDLNDESADYRHNLGTLLLSAGNTDGAIEELQQAIDLEANHPEAAGSLAAALLAAGDTAQAQEWFETAARNAPNDAQLYLGYGTCLYAQGRTLEAIACLQKAVRIHPHWPEARYRCALARLAQGDYTSAWADYPWRAGCPQLKRGVSELPQWNGGAARGQRILVQADRSVSDTLLFLRFLKRLTERRVSFVLDVPPPLRRLIIDSGFENLVADDASTSPCNLQAPLWSLPILEGITSATIPPFEPYLSADDERVVQWQTRLQSLAGLKVGVAWRGHATNPLGAVRAIPPAAMGRLAAVPGVQLVSLQVGSNPVDQAARGSTETGSSFAPHDLGLNRESDWAETAAIMKNLDLVISADVAVAHLAGAMGLRVWVALAVGADWCWMKDGETSPWYPTARLFRQSKPGDWSGVTDRLVEAIAPLAAAHNTGRTSGPVA